MLKSETREIGGHEWTITTMGADDGVEVGSELFALLLPVAGKAMSAVGSVKDFMDMDLSALDDAAGELAARLREPAVRKLLKKLVTTGVHCDGKEVKDSATSFNLLFAGEYDLLLQVAAFSIEVNFKLPFASWLSALRSGLAQQAMQSASAPSDSLANS